MTAPHINKLYQEGQISHSDLEDSKPVSNHYYILKNHRSFCSWLLQSEEQESGTGEGTECIWHHTAKC